MTDKFRYSSGQEGYVLQKNSSRKIGNGIVCLGNCKHISTFVVYFLKWGRFVSGRGEREVGREIDR